MPWDSAGRKVEKGDQQCDSVFALWYDLQANALMQLPMMSFKCLSWMSCCETACWSRGNWTRRSGWVLVAACTGSWVTWGHWHVAYILRAWHRRGRGNY